MRPRLPRWTARIVVHYQRFAYEGRLVMGELKTALARDLSERGLFLAASDLSIGQRVHLFIQLEDGPCLEAFGEVVHDAPLPAASVLSRKIEGVGIRLLPLSPREHKRMQAWLSEREAAETASIEGLTARLRAQAHLTAAVA